MATAASAQASSPVAAAASASAEPYMAFHSVRTLSSSPGLTRVGPGRQQDLPARLDEGITPEGGADRSAQDGAALEVPLGRHPEPVDQRLGHRPRRSPSGDPASSPSATAAAIWSGVQT